MRLAELYTSVQGEGPNVGKPTQFVRFGGCNLRCPGWPCDTEYAIDPKYRDQWTQFKPETIAAVIPPWPQNICLTGGEPFLQPASELQALVEHLISEGYRVEAFTNGTIIWPEWTRWPDAHVSMVFDYKLPGSGEDQLPAAMLQARYRNVAKFREGVDALKFTIVDEHDYYVARDTWHNFSEIEPVYAGVVWGKEMTNEHLVELMLADNLPWRLNVQVHKHVWSAEAKGV